MKTKSRTKIGRPGFPKRALLRRSVLGASLLACAVALGADDAKDSKDAKDPADGAKKETKKELTPEQMFEGGETTYNNWIELSTGGLFISGNKAQAEQVQRLSRGVFGGIEDLHFQKEIAKATTFSLDGQSIFDEHNYRLKLGVQKEEFGFVRFGFENFRTWDAGLGGSFAPDGRNYQLGDTPLSLDRGQVTFEAALFKKDVPKLNFKYTHRYRDGEKSSTSWGPIPTSFGTRGLVPGLYDLDEKSDTFQFDASYRIKKTEVGVGIRYETGTLNDAHKFSLLFDPSNPYRLTDRQQTTYDALNVHAYTETWLKKNLFLSTGFMRDTLDSEFTGSRIYGNDFDVSYTPGFPVGYLDLNGGAHKTEYVANINLMASALKNFTLVPSLRFQKDDWNSDSTGTGTRSSSTATFVGHADREAIDVRERLDLRYTGFTNWVIFASSEWTQEQGNLKENGGLGQINNIGIAPINRNTDDEQHYQKYSLGARWYPLKVASIDAGVYYKLNEYDYTHSLDSTPNNLSTSDAYPAFLIFQGFETYDGNIRLTLRPVNKITLVSRYEYQIATIHTAPDSASGLSQVEASKMDRHIFGQNASWTPLNWLSLQAGFNYVSSLTKSPISDYTQAVLNAQNNYWTVNFNAGLILDNKTDLNLGYYYYRAADFQPNYSAGVPYGAGASENSVTVQCTRRLTQQLRLNLKYAFTHYTDTASAGAFNYDAHMVFTSLQYRF